MTNVLGISGKKQSGKNTCANWIIGNAMSSMEVVSYIKIDNDGRLIVPALIDGELVEGAFDPLSKDKNVQKFLTRNVWPVVKIYSFADPLKEMVHNIFGIPYENLYGTDKQKEEPTQYTYGNFFQYLDTKEKTELKGQAYKKINSRKILQIMGSLYRQIYNEIWVEATIRKIKNEKPELAIIADVRYPNEVAGIQSIGGKVVRLTRNVCETDEHESETALDDFENWDAVIDNNKMSIQEQNYAITNIINGWNFITWQWEDRTSQNEE